MLLYRFPLIRLSMCYFDTLGCPGLWAALGSPGLLWAALGYLGLFGPAQGCSGSALVQIHTWLYWGHMWHLWHLGHLGLLWECICANTHLAVLGHMWHLSPKP